MRHHVCLIVAAAVLLEGCSSKPRTFAPQLAASSAVRADDPMFQQALLGCRREIAGRLDKKGRLGSAAAGAATGAMAGAAAGVAASGGTYATMGAAMAVTAAAMAVIPVAGVIGAVSVSKMKRGKKERAIRAAMTECLGRSGYTVDKWDRLSKAEALRVATQVKAAPAATPVVAPAPATTATATP